MAEHKFKNCTFGNIPQAQSGDTFERCNFIQLEPHTGIFSGLTGLRFYRCKLVNCDIPEDSVTEDCRPYHMEWCTNINPSLVSKGLTACAENCTHVVSTDTVTIDGQVVATIYHYEDKAVS